MKSKNKNTFGSVIMQSPKCPNRFGIYSTKLGIWILPPHYTIQEVLNISKQGLISRLRKLSRRVVGGMLKQPFIKQRLKLMEQRDIKEYQDKYNVEYISEICFNFHIDLCRNTTNRDCLKCNYLTINQFNKQKYGK